jgi:hypothetical protein
MGFGLISTKTSKESIKSIKGILDDFLEFRAKTPKSK